MLSTPHYSKKLLSILTFQRRKATILLKGGSAPIFHNKVGNEVRGRQYKVTPAPVREADSLLEEVALEFKGKALTWEQVATEVGAAVSRKTMWNTLKAALDYHKCLAYLKGWLDDKMMAKRVEYAEIMLSRYPLKEQWKRVRFSDELHSGFGPQGQLHIIRKPGVRYRQDCVQYGDKPAEKDEKRVYAWAAIWWNFKSDIHFYTVPSNHNGKMTMDVCINQILKPVVLPRIKRGDNFVLEED